MDRFNVSGQTGPTFTPRKTISMDANNAYTRYFNHLKREYSKRGQDFTQEEYSKILKFSYKSCKRRAKSNRMEAFLKNIGESDDYEEPTSTTPQKLNSKSKSFMSKLTNSPKLLKDSIGPLKSRTQDKEFLDSKRDEVGASSRSPSVDTNVRQVNEEPTKSPLKKLFRKLSRKENRNDNGQESTPSRKWLGKTRKYDINKTTEPEMPLNRKKDSIQMKTFVSSSRMWLRNRNNGKEAITKSSNIKFNLNKERSNVQSNKSQSTAESEASTNSIQVESPTSLFNPQTSRDRTPDKTENVNRNDSKDLAKYYPVIRNSKSSRKKKAIFTTKECNVDVSSLSDFTDSNHNQGSDSADVKFPIKIEIDSIIRPSTYVAIKSPQKSVISKPASIKCKTTQFIADKSKNEIIPPDISKRFLNELPNTSLATHGMMHNSKNFYDHPGRSKDNPFVGRNILKSTNNGSTSRSKVTIDVSSLDFKKKSSKPRIGRRVYLNTGRKSFTLKPN